MHRAYQPTTAANNRLLKKRWDQRQYDLHRNKVADIKPQIDNNAPRTYMHMHLKVKRSLKSRVVTFSSLKNCKSKKSAWRWWSVTTEFCSRKWATLCARKERWTTGTSIIRSRSTSQGGSGSFSESLTKIRWAADYQNVSIQFSGYFETNQQ